MRCLTDLAIGILSKAVVPGCFFQPILRAILACLGTIGYTHQMSTAEADLDQLYVFTLGIIVIMSYLYGSKDTLSRGLGSFDNPGGSPQLSCSSAFRCLLLAINVLSTGRLERYLLPLTWLLR